MVHKKLEMRKLLTQCLLSVDQKHQQGNDWEQGLHYLSRIRTMRYVTIDKTWIHYYTRLNQINNQLSAQQIVKKPTRPKTQQSAGKVMTSIFWDAQGISFIDYL